MGLLNPIQGIITDAKEKVLDVDLNKNGIPDALETLDASEEGLDFLAEIFDDIDAEEAEAILNALMQFRKPEKRATGDQIKEGAAKVAAIGPGLHAARKVLDLAEDELVKGTKHQKAQEKRNAEAAKKKAEEAAKDAV